MSYKSKFFKDSEFKCKCCGVAKMDEEVIQMLDLLRQKCGFPIILTSAYRCPKHNVAVSKTGPTGPHTTGKAVDVACSHEKAYQVVKYAIELGFTGIGVAQKGGSRFIHLDTLEAPHYPRPNVWTY